LQKLKFMNLEERICQAKTHQFRMVFPCYLNDNGFLFGGTALQWMDEVAYITAQRFTRMRMVTVSVGSINFLKSIYPGSMVEIIGSVNKVGKVKIEIRCEIFVESIENFNRELAVNAAFTFAAINSKNKPICLDLSLI
jgi:acyl-CoA hydrolase